MKIVFTGSRAWRDQEYIARTIEALQGRFGHFHAIVGTALNPHYPPDRQIGADQIVHLYCGTHHIPFTVVDAKWGLYGDRAGPLRNREMLDLWPDLVVAFRLYGASKGTDDTVNEARRRGIPVIEHRVTIEVREDDAVKHLTVESRVDAGLRSELGAISQGRFLDDDI